MIDLHCHILPGIDDGAPDLDTALAMARIAAADGVKITACTPHLTPGVYDNRGPGIRAAVAAFQRELDQAGVALRLTHGSDIHLAPDLPALLRRGEALALADSRYFLFEPPHRIAPPRLAEAAEELLDAGFIPVVTHPERLSWIEDHYETMRRMAASGAWMQITAGALTGRFGRRPRYWGERMLDEGLVHILATDAHNLGNRAPLLSEGREAAALRLGEEEADWLVNGRPDAILNNADPATVPPPPGSESRQRRGVRGLVSRLFHVS